MKLTDAIAMENIKAMLKLYERANPSLSKKECFELMKEKERTFLGLDIKLRPNKKRRKK